MSLLLGLELFDEVTDVILITGDRQAETEAVSVMHTSAAVAVSPGADERLQQLVNGWDIAGRLGGCQCVHLQRHFELLRPANSLHRAVESAALL